MARVQLLLNEIEIARHRLNYAAETDNEKLALSTLKQLTNLNLMLEEETKKKMEPAVKTEKHFLVFSELHMDGIVLSQKQYRALYKDMSHFDRESHQAIEVPYEAKDMSEQAIFLAIADQKKTG